MANHRYLLALLCLPFILHVTAEQYRNASKTLGPVYKPELYSTLPTQVNFGHCCKYVLSKTFFVENDTLYLNPEHNFFRGTLDSLEAFPQFPCDATFNGTVAGPPQQFWVPYSWCHDQCTGWSTTKPGDLKKWLKPMIAFILPSLIFCLSVPRRRRIRVPSVLFTDKQVDILNLLTSLLKVPIAAIVVTLDIVLWTCIVFSVAGPLVTSGIYEAILDARLLGFLDGRIKHNYSSLRERSHIMLTILIGNLDGGAWNSTLPFVQILPGYSPRTRFSSARLVRGDSTVGPSHSSSMVRQTTHMSSYTSGQSSQGSNSLHDSTEGKARPVDAYYEPVDQVNIDIVKSRLHAMMDSQPSFGASVGAAILFYIGSYIWSVYEVREDLGAAITAHHIGIGMFWMTMPHLALVSCILLAGNNPSIWQQVAPHDTPEYRDPFARDGNIPSLPDQGSAVELHPLETDEKNDKLSLSTRIVDYLFPMAYEESEFKPAWMWKRGTNKAMWIAKLAEQYRYLEPLQKEVLESRYGNYLWISGIFGFTLYFVPIFFGALISYMTPREGLACRSIMMLIYGVSQFTLQVLWMIDMVFWQRKSDGTVRSFESTGKPSSWPGYLWYIVFALSVFLGAFSSIGGTLFVLINVYQNCFCNIPAKYWWNRWQDPEALIFVGNSTAPQIYNAQKWWFPAGVVGVVFMTIVAYIGWWYQRSLRHRFHRLVSMIDHIDELNLREGERTD